MIDKIANPAAAAGAYANTAKTALAGDAQTTGKASFGDVLRSTTIDAIGAMHKGESMAAKAVTGDATLPDVVQAVNAAELTLSTVVAVRDRMINAYQEIMRSQV